MSKTLLLLSPLIFYGYYTRIVYLYTAFKVKNIGRVKGEIFLLGLHTLLTVFLIWFD
jgi:hypothetical protein